MLFRAYRVQASVLRVYKVQCLGGGGPARMPRHQKELNLMSGKQLGKQNNENPRSPCLSTYLNPKNNLLG